MKPRSARQVAVALGYDWSGPAPPRVLAAGQGPVAERIVATARASGVALREDAALAGALVRLKAGSYVPPELWNAVAVVLAFLYRGDAAAGSGVRPPASG
jgi:flagellar biosynthesis protein